MKKLISLLVCFSCCFCAVAQTGMLQKNTIDTLRLLHLDTLKPLVLNHAPQLLQKEPEILWFNNFRQVVSFQFPTRGFYKDQEGHEVAFRLLTKHYPGIRLSPEGVLSCQLSLAEYQHLPFTVEYEIFETNTLENLTIKGQIVLKKSQIDVPPNIVIHPKTLKYSIEETDSVAIKIVVADSNDDLKTFEIYSSVQYGRFNPEQYLTKINNNTYLFKWQPSFDFVQLRNLQEEPKRTFQLMLEATDYTDTTTRIAIEMEDAKNNVATIEEQYPIEFATVTRFQNIVIHLKNLFVETEQFIGRYRLVEARRVREFLSEKEQLQRTVSSVSKDSSLKLVSINSVVSQSNIDNYFNR